MKEEARANGDNTMAYLEMDAAMDKLKAEINDAEITMKSWERGISNADKQIANADKNIQKYTIAQNEAKASSGRMEQVLSEQERRIRTHAEAWEAAERKLRSFSDTAKSAGKLQEDAGKKLTRASMDISYAGVTAAQAATPGSFNPSWKR